MATREESARVDRDKPVTKAKADAAERELKKVFKDAKHEPVLARLKAARTRGDYLQAYAELHDTTLEDIERVRL